MEYTTNLNVKLRVRDVEDEYEAIRYFEDFVSGVSTLAESDDEYDDHYRVDECYYDWNSFKETYDHGD